MDYGVLPTVNAGLNALSAVLLLTGFTFIKNRRVAAHRFCMITAVATSTIFLVSYLVYHAHAGVVRFHGAGWLRWSYLAILSSHTFLAIMIVPLVLITLRHALREAFEKHRGMARKTFPLWVYVSVTGVVVYFMLYH